MNTPSPINRVKVKGQEESNGEVMERGKRKAQRSISIPEDRVDRDALAWQLSQLEREGVSHGGHVLVLRQKNYCQQHSGEKVEEGTTRCAHTHIPPDSIEVYGYLAIWILKNIYRY